MSGNSVERLVYMANQIAKFFVTQPGDAAALQIADHINAFWDPRMRRLIVDHVDHGGGGLEPAALKAVHLLKVAPADGVERALEHSGASSPARRPGDDAG